jgi:hypothetical protein
MCRFAGACLLGLRLRIPPEAWLPVCNECCVLSVGVFDRPVCCPEEFCKECVLVSLSAIMCCSNPVHMRFVVRTGWTKEDSKRIYPLQ